MQNMTANPALMFRDFLFAVLLAGYLCSSPVFARENAIPEQSVESAQQQKSIEVILDSPRFRELFLELVREVIQEEKDKADGTVLSPPPEEPVSPDPVAVPSPVEPEPGEDLSPHSSDNLTGAYKIISLDSDDDGEHDITVAIIDAQSVIPVIIGFSQQFPEGISPRGALALGLADIVLGSGFVSSFYPLVPNGWLRIDGNELSKPNMAGYSRMVSIEKNELSISTRDSDDWRSDGIRFGVQVGPGVVDAGSAGISPSELNSGDKGHKRALLGLCGNSYILAVTKNRSHLYPLAKYFTSDTFAETTGVVCSEVVNFSGGSEAVLGWVPPEAEYEEPVYEGNAKTARASMIGFKVIENFMTSQQNWQGEEPSELPGGAVVRACGCWGNVNFFTRDRAPNCSSGFGEAVPCKFLCRAGGYAWSVQCL